MLPSALSATVPFVTVTDAPPATMAVPFTCVIVSGLPSTSLSFVLTVTAAEVSSLIVPKLSFTATGGSFTAVTVPLTVADAVPPLPSLIVYVNEAGPL